MSFFKNKVNSLHPSSILKKITLKLLEHGQNKTSTLWMNILYLKREELLTGEEWKLREDK